MLVSSSKLSTNIRSLALPVQSFLLIYVVIDWCKKVLKFLKDKKRNRCYSFSFNFLIGYVNGCPETKTLSLKYPHQQLLIKTSQFSLGRWHKLRKSKHYYFYDITFPWKKLWRWQSADIYVTMISFCLRNLNVYSSVTQKLSTKNFWVFLKCTIAGLSMNIFCAGDKLPMQRGFSKNGRGDLLPTLRFLGRLYNFCNFVTGHWTLVR